jgi:ABC-type Fe3+/spermidine/putrescine transport system ATPase subunit
LASGAITWDGADVTALPTHKREFGLMFQGYALFPHMDVAGNVGFGLKMAGIAPDEIRDRVDTALHWVGLAGFGERAIVDLSGGEKQRVALARTLAPEPVLVMLDEPLGALDRALRERLMTETRQILTERGVTTLVVTHDREEADALSDRLALMRDGTIVQSGTLEELLDHPADDWVKDFLS